MGVSYLTNFKAGFHCIYGLREPDFSQPHGQGVLRYIGKTCNLHARLKNHLDRAKSKKRLPVANWLASLLACGLYPVVEEIKANLLEEEAGEEEQFWIMYHKGKGSRLLNLTDGGEGMSGYKHTRETSRAMSQKASENNRKKWQRPKYRENLLAEFANSEKIKARWKDPEYRDRMIDAFKKGRKPLTDKQRQALSARAKAMWADPEKRKALQQSLRRPKRPFSQETRLRMSLAKKGMPISQETLAKRMASRQINKEMRRLAANA